MAKKMIEKEKMISGMDYSPLDPRLIWERDRTSRLLKRYNQSTFHEVNMRHRLLKKLLHTTGNFWVKPPFYCDYGYNIYLGKEVMLNYGCVLLDVCPIYIGDHTLIGPYTQIYTACHSLDSQKRKKSIEYGKPVVIGQNVWIGGGCIILPGVTIGDNSVIGAGSVVTKDIEANVIAVGNPCKVIKKNEEQAVRSYE